MQGSMDDAAGPPAALKEKEEDVVVVVVVRDKVFVLYYKPVAVAAAKIVFLAKSCARHISLALLFLLTCVCFPQVSSRFSPSTTCPIRTCTYDFSCRRRYTIQLYLVM